MTTTNQQVWPDGVFARYYTKAAEITGDLSLRVDVRAGDSPDKGKYVARCTGCPAEWSSGMTAWNLDHLIRPWAAAHAEKCRAEGRPAEPPGR